MALVQLSGTAVFAVATTRITLYGIPASQNANIKYFSLSANSAIAAGSNVQLREETGANALVNFLGTLSNIVASITSPTEYAAKGGNNINLVLSVGAVLTVFWSITLELL